MIADYPTVWLERCLEILDTDPATAQPKEGVSRGNVVQSVGPGDAQTSPDPTETSGGSDV